MIMFFYFTEMINIQHDEFGVRTLHKFEAAKGNKISSDKIYFSTPSDFQGHAKRIEQQLGPKKDRIFVMQPAKVVANPHWPKDIGFKQLEEEVKEFKGRPVFKLAFINGMSNALGDHLIGMHAFDHFYDKLSELLPETELEITFFQLSPYRTRAITKQWRNKFSHVYMLPNKLSKILEYDAFIDLGGMLLRENFDKMPMIDFYLEACSIDPASVPQEKKQMTYKVDEDVQVAMERVFRNIRAQRRPVLLFHHSSTSEIRGMSNARARTYIKHIIENTDYFVVSACGLEYQNKRFLDLRNFSKNIDCFASIISLVDAIITVDTSTYHIASAFNTPTVAVFTTIDPDLRVRYYDNVHPIMLEEKDGKLYGKHKCTIDNQSIKDAEVRWADALWDKFDIEEALDKLKAT
jgi:ADP-heptose:LPS heptosyltransferase